MERRSKVARQIYERHFTANSIEPVNIDNSTSRCIRDAVMAQRFSAQLYDVAQYQVNYYFSLFLHIYFCLLVFYLSRAFYLKTLQRVVGEKSNY